VIRKRIAGLPVAQGSMRSVGKRMIHENHEKLETWRDLIAYQMLRYRGAFPRGTPVAVLLVFEFPRPARSRDRAKFKTTAPDLDKLVRAVADALTMAGVWEDDAQMARLNAWKQYGEPGVTIQLREA
jgi:Holliday junction resolvase RusA-like endonuclease